MNDCAVRYCCICGKRFESHPRLGAKQRTCGGDGCQKKRRRDNTRIWRARHPEADDALCRRTRQGDSRHAYRRQYWATHPQARQHHADYMRQWRARRKASVTTSVRYTYRDTQAKLPNINTYLQVIGVREANRVITAKLLSRQEIISSAPA